MGKISSVSSPALQIFFFCLVPNLGGWIMFAILGDRIKDMESEEKVKSFLEPPDWVKLKA